MIRSLILQIKFLTRIPIPGNAPFDEEKFARGVIYAPIAGLIVGLCLVPVFYLGNLTGQIAVAAILTITAEIIITGGLHLDGLADTCDGLFSNRPREMMLEIMRDSRIGTNGTLALILVILIKAALLASLNPDDILKYIIAMPVISRMSIAWSAGNSTYARSDGGLGKALIDNAGTREIMLATIISVLASGFFLKIKIIPGIIAVIFFTLAASGYVKKKIGGTTGDTLGAVIEVSEIIFLLTMNISEEMAL